MRIRTRVLVVAAVVFLLVAGLWGPVVTPRLVKFPLNLDLHITYTGSMVTYMNPATGLPLAHPSVVPLTVQRHTYAVPSLSTSSTAMVRDDVTAKTATGLSFSQTSLYAIDRRSIKNVNSPLTWALAPGNHVNRAGTYFISLPMGLNAGSIDLPVWKEEMDGSYRLVANRSHPTGSLDGLGVVQATAKIPMTPAASYETRILGASGLPLQLTPAQAMAQLQARSGVSVTAVASALAARLSPAQLATLSAVLSSPLKLSYYVYGSGNVAAEPKTGTIVSASSVVDGRAVEPNTSSLAPVVAVLQANTGVPGVPALLSAMRAMTSAGPQPVYQLQYSETPASVAMMVSWTKSQIRKMDLVQLWIPVVAAVVGVLLAVAAALTFRRRPTPPVVLPERGVPEVTEAPRAAA